MGLIMVMRCISSVCEMHGSDYLPPCLERRINTMEEQCPACSLEHETLNHAIQRLVRLSLFMRPLDFISRSRLGDEPVAQLSGDCSHQNWTM